MAYLSVVLGMTLPCRRREVLECGLISLSDLAEHPTDRLVNEIFFIAKEQCGDAKRVGEFTLPDEIMRCDDADAPFPEAGRARELHQRLTTLVVQISADDLAGRGIDQVPVVDVTGVAKVELIDLLPGSAITFGGLPNEDQERKRAVFMNGRAQEHPQITEREGLVLFAQPVHHLGAKTEENVPLAVLPRATLEETGRHGGSFGATEPAQMLLNLGGRHGAPRFYGILTGSASGLLVEPVALWMRL